MQSALRNLRVPAKPPHHVFCLDDEEGIAGLVHWIEIDGPGAIDLAQVGVALRLRGQGGDVASELLRQAFDEMTARAVAADVEEIDVLGMIYHENHPSQRLARAAGFVQTGQGAPGVQEWSGRIIVAGAT